MVSRDVIVLANWKGSRGNNFGIKVRYADAPDLYIPGMTAGTQYGISFKPDSPFESGKTVDVTVEAGLRAQHFSFTTGN